MVSATSVQPGSNAPGSSVAREEHRDAQPGDRVDQKCREKRDGRKTEAEGLPDPADENCDHAYGADKARHSAHRAEPRLGARRQPPCGRTCRIQHPAQGPSSNQDAPQAEQHRDPSGEPGLLKCRADLLRHASREPSLLVHGTRIDNFGGDAGHSDREEQQGEEKRKSRNASALLITDPAARWSLRKVPATTSTTGTPWYLASHRWAVVTRPRVAAANLARPVSSVASPAVLSPALSDFASRCVRSGLLGLRRRIVMDSPKHPLRTSKPAHLNIPCRHSASGARTRAARALPAGG